MCYRGSQRSQLCSLEQHNLRSASKPKFYCTNSPAANELVTNNEPTARAVPKALDRENTIVEHSQPKPIAQDIL